MTNMRQRCFSFYSLPLYCILKLLDLRCWFEASMATQRYSPAKVLSIRKIVIVSPPAFKLTLPKGNIDVTVF